MNELPDAPATTILPSASTATLRANSGTQVRCHESGGSEAQVHAAIVEVSSERDVSGATGVRCQPRDDDPAGLVEGGGIDTAWRRQRRDQDAGIAKLACSTPFRS